MMTSKHSKENLGSTNDNGIVTNALTPTQRKAVNQFENDEKANENQNGAGSKQQKVKDSNKHATKSSPPSKMLVSIIQWLYNLMACCNPLATTKEKKPQRNKRGILCITFLEIFNC